MLRYADSDIYRLQNNGNMFTKRIVTALDNASGINVVNDSIGPVLDQLLKAYKENAVIKAVNAVKKHDLLLIRSTDPLKRLPDILPFVKVRREGKEMVILDISRWYIPNRKTVNDDDDEKYTVSIPKLHDTIIPAFLALELFGANMTLPFEANRNLAVLWADTMLNVLQRVGFFGSNLERREAYRYFCMKFYLMHFLQCPTPVVDQACDSMLRNGKNPMLLAMEAAIERMELKPFSSVTEFFRTIFNAEVSGVKGLTQDLSKSLTMSEFIRKFTDMYGPEAIGAFYSPEYFFYVLYVAYQKADIVRDRSFDYIVSSGKGNGAMSKLILALFKEI